MQSVLQWQKPKTLQRFRNCHAKREPDPTEPHTITYTRNKEVRTPLPRKLEEEEEAGTKRGEQVN